MITESKRTVGTWSMLFQRALPLCNDVEEAVLCADIALSSLSKEDIITLYENKTPQENKERISQEELSTFFAYDVHNRKAQGILNRSLQSVKGLTVSAKKDLESILKRKSKDPSKAILEFIDKYRVQLAKLLTTTQLASVLEGAREVAKGIPTLAVFAGATNLPPSLEPKDAVVLVDRLKKLSVEDRAKAIYDLPSDQQTYAQHAVAAAEAGGMEPPPLVRVSSYESDDIHLPTIEEAVKSLSERNVVTRQQFDELDAAARTKAFTVANVSAEETLTKIRDSLSENVKEGVDYETWRKKVMEDVDQGTFLSEAHQETVFRTNVQSAFSDGQMTVLRHPLVRSGFPYSAYDSIHDGRRRENHGKLEKLGIQGTNVYRNDDPVFQTFRPPWDYNDRCGWTPMTIRQAAEKGIEEAKKWLDTGVEPTDKAHVPMPDFAPPPEFQRALASAPLSIRLSLQSIEVFNSPAPHDDRGQALSVTEDTYPRNASNQFLDKFLVAEAARSKAKHEELRESLPEDQRWKLDRCVGWLQSGGTIHHPKERPGLAINISGLVDSKDWLEYSFKADAYDKWLERDQVRRDWKADVEKFTKTLRHSEPAAVAYRGLAAIGVDDTITETREAVDEVLGKYNSYLDELDSQFESIGATEQEVRTTARLRRSVNLDITNAVEKYIHLRKTSDDKSLISDSLNNLLDTFQSTTTKVNSSYEEVVECVCKRIEDDTSADEEPEEPQEPNEEGEQRSDPIMLAIGGQPRNAPSEIIYRFAHFRSKYSDTVILNVRTGIQNKLGHVPNIQLPQGTQLTVVGEDREQDGTRSIIAAVTKWGGNVSMSIGDKAQSPEEEKEERSTIIAGILVALFGNGAIDVAKELFKKSPDGDINAAFANGPPQVQRRYGRRPGPGWTAHGVTGRGVQIWIWGQNNQAGAAQQPPAPQQPAAPAAPAPSPTPQTPPPVAVPTPTPPTPPPAQPQAAQLRAGGQRARFQSIQAYNAAMAKLSAGQQLTQADKLSLATKLTNMPTPMLRSLHGALVQPGMPGPHFTRPGHINAIKNIINPPPQTPAPPVVGPGPGVGGAPGPMPSGLQVRPPAPTPAQMPSGLQVKPPAAPQVPQGPPQPTTPAVPKSTQKQVWTTGQAQPGTSLNGIPFAPAPPKFWEKTPDVDVKEPPPLKTVNRVGVLIQEPDGRMWIVQPTNGFGNRNHTLPGGTVEKGLTNQQNALKEVWEETGLQVEITGHAGDFEDSNNGNNGRLYIGKRVGGAPWDAKIESFIIDQKTGKPAAESETVTLVPPEEAAKLLHRTDDLAQLMVVHPMPVKTPTTGAGSNPLKKLVAALAPKAEAYTSKKHVGDGYLHAVQEMRGFNAKPKVISKQDFDTLLTQGGHIEMHRGIGKGGGKTGQQFADQFRDGDHFPGYGCFGNGTYADSTPHNNPRGNAAAGYASFSSRSGGAIVRIALPKTAKIIKQSELEKMVSHPPSGYSTIGGHTTRDQWLGLHAALAGYDAIEVDGKSASHGSYGKGFYVILNRGACVVQKENVTNETIK